MQEKYNEFVVFLLREVNVLMSKSRSFCSINVLVSKSRFFCFAHVFFWCYIYRVVKRNSVVYCIRDDCFSISWWMRLCAWNLIISISFVRISSFCELNSIEVLWIDWIKIMSSMILIKRWRYCRQIIRSLLDTWRSKSKTFSLWFESSINSFFSSFSFAIHIERSSSEIFLQTLISSIVSTWWLECFNWNSESFCAILSNVMTWE